MNRVLQFIGNMRLTIVRLGRDEGERMIYSTYLIRVYKNGDLHTSFLLAVFIRAVFQAESSAGVFHSLLASEGEQPRVPHDLDDKIAELVAAAIYEMIKKNETKSDIKDDQQKEGCKQ